MFEHSYRYQELSIPGLALEGSAKIVMAFSAYSTILGLRNSRIPLAADVESFLGDLCPHHKNRLTHDLQSCAQNF